MSSWEKHLESRWGCWEGEAGK